MNMQQFFKEIEPIPGPLIIIYLDISMILYSLPSILSHLILIKTQEVDIFVIHILQIRNESSQMFGAFPQSIIENEGVNPGLQSPDGRLKDK